MLTGSTPIFKCSEQIAAKGNLLSNLGSDANTEVTNMYKMIAYFEEFETATLYYTKEEAHDAAMDRWFGGACETEVYAPDGTCIEINA